jgi:hypothetical protein
MPFLGGSRENSRARVCFRLSTETCIVYWLECKFREWKSYRWLDSTKKRMIVLENVSLASDFSLRTLTETAESSKNQSDGRAGAHLRVQRLYFMTFKEHEANRKAVRLRCRRRS